MTICTSSIGSTSKRMRATSVTPIGKLKTFFHSSLFETCLALGHVPGRFDPKPVMHFDYILSLLVLHPHSHPLSPNKLSRDLVKNWKLMNQLAVPPLDSSEGECVGRALRGG